MQRPIGDYATQDFVQPGETMRVDAALRLIREHRSTGQTLIYFYVVDTASRLTGVLQTRTLLTAEPEERLADIMIQHVIAIPETATVLDACEFFVLHKFLAFPIIDRERHITARFGRRRLSAQALRSALALPACSASASPRCCTSRNST